MTTQSFRYSLAVVMAAFALFVTACGDVETTPTPDAGYEAGADATPDAGSDVNVDATPDAGIDATPDAGSDAGSDPCATLEEIEAVLWLCPEMQPAVWEFRLEADGDACIIVDVSDGSTPIYEYEPGVIRLINRAGEVMSECTPTL